MAAKNSNSPTSREAYLIGGHGSEDVRSTPLILPDNVYVVVKAKAGETTNTADLLEMKLCQLSNEVLQNPLAHLGEIHDAIGSFILYEPGSKWLCPNFRFHTVSSFIKKTQSVKFVTPKLSGIMNITDVKKGYAKDKLTFRYIYSTNEKEFIENMFESDKYSFTQVRVENNGKWITEYVANDIITECTINNLEILDKVVPKEELLETLQYINDLDAYRTNMYDILFNFDETGLLKHGAVFYHLNCRSRINVSKKLYMPKNFNNMNYDNVVRSQQIVINSVPSRKNDPELYKLVKNTISNAEMMKYHTRSIMTRKKNSPQQSIKQISSSVQDLIHKNPVNTEQYITNVAFRIIIRLQEHVRRQSTDINIAKIISSLMDHGIVIDSIILLCKKLDQLLSYYKRNELLFKKMHTSLLDKLCEVFVMLLYRYVFIDDVYKCISIIVYDETFYKKGYDTEKKVFEYIEEHYRYHPKAVHASIKK